MNGPIRRVAMVVMVIFLALLANLSIGYLGRQTALNQHPENRRVTDAQFAQDRGAILVGNTPIATTSEVKDRFKFQRKYPQGPLYAPITGFYSYYFKSSALESSYSPQLSGTDDALFLQRMIDMATGTKPKGASVQTTIDARAQKAAWEALAGRKGAVVALNPKTGAILAMVTSPSYDPNTLATHNLPASQRAWNRLNKDSDRPMSNRSAKEIYPPGSTFKLIVSAAALEAGSTPDTQIDAPTVLKLPGSTARLHNAGNCGGTKVTLQQALTVSCNTAFANLGMKLGADALRTQARNFGFGTTYLPEIGTVASRFPADPDRAQTAMSSIGQFEVAATPLQMAMVAGAIANDGVVMEPYLVDSVQSPNLQVLSKTRPQQLSRAVSASTARQLRQMMISVVQNGTGRRAQISGLEIGGKTGTAHSDKKRAPYAWFVAFSGNPDVAVAVFVQDAGMDTSDIAGGRVAAPIAKSVIEALR